MEVCFKSPLCEEGNALGLFLLFQWLLLWRLLPSFPALLCPKAAPVLAALPHWHDPSSVLHCEGVGRHTELCFVAQVISSIPPRIGRRDCRHGHWHVKPCRNNRSCRDLRYTDQVLGQGRQWKVQGTAG